MIKVTVSRKNLRALKRMIESGARLKEAYDKAMLAECKRMLRKLWTDQQKELLNMEARRLAQWLKAQRG